MKKPIVFAFAIAVLVSTAAAQDVFRAQLTPADGLAYFYPSLNVSELTISEKAPANVSGLPKVPKIRYGAIKLGNAPNSPMMLALAGSGGDAPKLYIDRNRNKNFADDKPVDPKEGPFYRYDFTAPAFYKDGKRTDESVVVVFPIDPSEGPPLYFLNSFRKGEITLKDGKKVSIAIIDNQNKADFKNTSKLSLLVDPQAEYGFLRDPDLADPYAANEPFNINGTTYEIAFIDSSGLQIALRKSTKNVPERVILAIGNKAPDFTADDTDGNKVSLSDYRGKVTLLDFWATWCPPCIQEMPHVKKAYETFKDKGFDILAVSLDRDKTSAAKYAKENGFGWRQISDGKGWQSEIGTLYKIRSIPASFLLDKEGRIIAKNLRGESLMKAIEKALQEN